MIDSEKDAGDEKEGIDRDLQYNTYITLTLSHIAFNTPLYSSPPNINTMLKPTPGICYPCYYWCYSCSCCCSSAATSASRPITSRILNMDVIIILIVCCIVNITTYNTNKITVSLLYDNKVVYKNTLIIKSFLSSIRTLGIDVLVQCIIVIIFVRQPVHQPDADDNPYNNKTDWDEFECFLAFGLLWVYFVDVEE